MRILISRLDNTGDVILAGPAVRAAAAHGHVTMLCGPPGADAARLLPGVDDVMVWDAPWVGFAPPAVDAKSVERLLGEIRRHRFNAAAILTSYHQSPLPLALLLRLGGVGRIAAVGVDYPGSLLDERVPYREELHEVEQALTVVASLGFHLPPGEDDRLRLSGSSRPSPVDGSYVVVHPGASVPARTLPSSLAVNVIGAMSAAGRRVLVTGTDEERRQLPIESLPGVDDLRGQTDFGRLVDVVAGAEVLVVGNSGPAHVAAATGTPVVSVFAPVVAMHRWRPWRVPSIVLGDQTIACAGCRSRRCPLEQQWCVADIDVASVLRAVETLAHHAPASAR